MADVHIEIAIGNLKFLATGSETWVDTKYDAFMTRFGNPKLAAPQKETASEPTNSDDSTNNTVPLAIFLKEKNVGSSQNNRFLATAVWLRRNGQTSIRTSDIVRALADAQQQRLGNPSDVLNQNVKKGHCVKTGDTFYVTPEGEDSLK